MESKIAIFIEREECKTMKVSILDVLVDTYTRKEALAALMQFLKEEKNHMVFTPNPEIVMEAQKDRELLKILNEADLVVPDGIGVVWASKFAKERITERVAGYDLIQALFNEIKDTEYTVYFFGGGKGVAEKAKQIMEQTYKNVKIIGVQDGYFDEEKEKIIIEDIKKQKPDILLVGLGVPKQEKWICKNKDLPVKISIGVGGSFDAMSGSLKRAPEFFIKYNLEWFYRLIKQPSRWKRQLRLPLFVLKVITTRRQYDK